MSSAIGTSIEDVRDRLSDLSTRLDALSNWIENTVDRVAELEDENAERLPGSDRGWPGGASDVSRSASQNAVRSSSSKEVYESLLRVVDYQTTGPDDDLPAIVREAPLYKILVAEGPFSHGAADRARRAALENGDLLRWRGPESRMRYAVVREDALRDVVAEQNTRDQLNEELVMRCKQLINSLEDDDD